MTLAFAGVPAFLIMDASGKFVIFRCVDVQKELLRVRQVGNLTEVHPTRSHFARSARGLCSFSEINWLTTAEQRRAAIKCTEWLRPLVGLNRNDRIERVFLAEREPPQPGKKLGRNEGKVTGNDGCPLCFALRERRVDSTQSAPVFERVRDILKT